MKIGYGRDKISGWYLFYLPGFLPLNGYIWSGRDHLGRRNYTGRLWAIRLRMLRTHWWGIR